MIILRGIPFGKVFTASGTLNFFGEGWPFHQLFRHIPGFDFNSSVFIAKTTTLYPQPGNMPLTKDLQPTRFLPDCIRVYPAKAVVLNAVGLSGPGAHELFERGEWQKRKKTFAISFMAVGKNREDRIKETVSFANLLRSRLLNFAAKIGLEINISCPNTRHDPQELAIEASHLLKFAAIADVPLILKVNALTPIETIKEIAERGFCDAIDCSNTIPYGAQPLLPDKIEWKNLFGEKSPLHHLGGGGLSGKPLLPIVARWIERVRTEGIKIPIIGGGGILSEKDVATLKDAGADAISIGSVAILRPWRVRGIIDYANRLFG